MELFDINKFIEAQDRFNTYETALNEVKDGEKRSHWIWYIFPQIYGLGHSSTSKHYCIKSLLEAKAYFENDTLRHRLYEITFALLGKHESAQDIFGDLDAMKVCSCMTLFNLVSPDDVFAEVLDRFYDNNACHRTLKIVEKELIAYKGDSAFERNGIHTQEKAFFEFGSHESNQYSHKQKMATMLDLVSSGESMLSLVRYYFWDKDMSVYRVSGVDFTVNMYLEDLINEIIADLKDESLVKDILEFRNAIPHDDCNVFDRAKAYDAFYMKFHDNPDVKAAFDVILKESLCNPMLKMPVLNAPASYRLMQIGQCRTLADIVKTLNTKNHYASFETLMKDFADVIETHKRKRGFDNASIELVEDILNNNEQILMYRGRFDTDRFEVLLSKEFESGKVTDIDALFTRRMCAKILILAKTLNDICQYTNIADLRYDLLSLATGRMNCGDASYMDDPYQGIGNWPINWFVSGLEHLWNEVSNNGILDNDLMEKRMFTDHQEKLDARGIDAVINEDYEDDGPCHPEVFFPKERGTGPVYVKDGLSRRFIKACGEGKGPRSGHEVYEMSVVSNILRREINKGEYICTEDGYYIPTKNLHKPIFLDYFGRLHFASFDEKEMFIEEHTI